MRILWQCFVSKQPLIMNKNVSLNKCVLWRNEWPQGQIVFSSLNLHSAHLLYFLKLLNFLTMGSTHFLKFTPYLGPHNSVDIRCFIMFSWLPVFNLNALPEYVVISRQFLLFDVYIPYVCEVCRSIHINSAKAPTYNVMMAYYGIMARGIC